jgi:hypothetical protein
MSSDQLQQPSEVYRGIPGISLRFFDAVFQNWIELLAISAVIGLITAVSSVGVSMLWTEGAAGTEFVVETISIVLGTIYGTLVCVLLSVRMGGTSLSVREAFAVGARRLPRVIAVSLACFIIVTIGFVLLIVPGIWLSIRLYLAGYVALFEPERNAFQRSWQLTRGHTWQTALLLLITAALIIPATILIALFTALVPPFPGSNVLSTALDSLVVYGLPSVLGLLAFGWFRIDRRRWHPPIAST